MSDVQSDDDGAASSRPEPADYGDVVALVRELGDEAIERFLDGLAPHLADVQRSGSAAIEGLTAYLRDCTISAVVIAESGGIEAVRQAGRIAAEAPASTREEAMAILRQLAS